MISAFVLGVGLTGPGLNGWTESVPVLTGSQAWISAAVRLGPPSILSANEQRRTGDAVRLALVVAMEASDMAGISPGAIPSLFATSNGDAAVMHAILETLAADTAVSPTQFHNSVHNAAAGYWSIGTGSHQPASCMAGHDGTVAAALLKAMAAVHTEQRPILLCVYDLPMPEPLGPKRPTEGEFGVAFVLAPEPGPKPLAEIAVAWHARPVPWAEGAPRSASLRALAGSNPAARVLRMLESLALGGEDRLALALLDGRVEVSLRACSTASEFSR